MRRSASAALALALVCGGAAPADDRAEMTALIARAVKAHGGAENLAKHKASVQTLEGKVFTQGLEIKFTGTWSEQVPDGVRAEMQLEVAGQNFTRVQVYHKGKGWISTNGQTTEMTEEMLAEAREEMHARTVTGLVDDLTDPKRYKLAPLGEIVLGEKPLVGVRVSREGYRDINLYFDKASGLLRKAEFRVKDVEVGGGAEVDTELLLGGYEKVDGVMVAHELTIKRDGKDFLTGRLTSYQAQNSLAEGTFEKP